MILQNTNETALEWQYPILASLFEDRQNQVDESTARDTMMMNGETGLINREHSMIYLVLREDD